MEENNNEKMEITENDGWETLQSGEKKYWEQKND